MADGVKFNPWHSPEMKKVVGWNGERRKGKGKSKSKGRGGKRKGGKGGGS